MRKGVRRNIYLPSEKLEKYFEKFQIDAGYSSFSYMVCNTLIKVSKEFYDNKKGENEKVLEQVENIMATTNQKIDFLNQLVEMVNIKLDKKQPTIKVWEAAGEIRNLALLRDSYYHELVHKIRKKYSDETINAAIIGLKYGLGDIGKSNKKRKKLGEDKNEKRKR